MCLRDELLKHVRDAYVSEEERKDRLISRLNLPIVMLVTLGGVLSYYLDNLPNFSCSIACVLFWIFFSGMSATLIMSWIYIAKFFFGYKYGYISTPKEFSDFTNSTFEYYQQLENPNAETLTNAELRELLILQYTKFGTSNTINNDRKTGYLRALIICVVLGVGLALLSAIPYFANGRPNRENVTSINIERNETKETGGTIMSEKTSNQSGQSDKTQPQKGGGGSKEKGTPKTVPTKPEKPKGRFIKEGDLKKGRNVIKETKE